MVLALALAACGSSHHVTPDSAPAPDAPPDSLTTGPNVVKLVYAGTPDLFVYRDGSGPWLEPDPPDAMGRYTLHVTDAYQVIAVCSPTSLVGSFDAAQLNATAGDGDQVLFCEVGGSGPQPTTVAVTGTMKQAGTVSMSDSKSSTTAPWSFQLNVDPGAHDLVAFGDGKLLLRRDQTITAATAVPTIDVDHDGAAMGAATLTVTGTMPGDIVQTDLDWYTAHDHATVSSTANLAVALPPASLVQSSDLVQLSVQDTSASAIAFRNVVVTGFDAAQTSLALPDVLSGISYTTPNNHLTMSWGTLPKYTSVAMSVLAGSHTIVQSQRVTATQSWIAATHATSLTFDTSAPRYNAGWNIDPTQPSFRIAGVSDQEAHVLSMSEVGELSGVVAARMPFTRLARQQRDHVAAGYGR
jgi:hypothetical protein